MIRRRILLVAALAVPACDQVPTTLEMPQWEQEWQVPGEAIEVSVAELLPTGVGLTDDSTAFVTTIAEVNLTFDLAEICSTCGALNGIVAPKPEFTDTIFSNTTLPADLISASLSGGEFALRLAHNLNFDPLRPSSDPDAPRGYLVVQVTSDGSVVAKDSVSGDDTAFDQSVVLTPVMAIQAVEVANNLDIAVIIHSPSGDPVVIDNSDTLGVQMLPAEVEISEATVGAAALEVDAPGTEMEFAMDSTMVDRIQSGALIFTVSNPFELNGSLTLAFETFDCDDGGGQCIPGPTVSNALTLQQGSFVDRLEFTGEELQTILNADQVNVASSGTLSSPTNTVTITPTQKLVMDTEFELKLLIGPLEGNDQ